MMHEHISSAYDRDLEGITTLIMKMGGLVEEAILKALLAAGEMSGWDARQGAPAHYPGLRL